MTERRPAHEPVPDFVERQIREAQARGDFDGLRGHGRPLTDLDGRHDELWWIKRKLRDENVTELPPALRARVERDRALAVAAAAPDESTVRRTLEQVNELIRRINRTTVHGPPTSVGPVDVEEVVGRWRAAGGDRQTPAPDQETEPAGAPGTSGSVLSRAARWVAVRVRRR